MKLGLVLFGAAALVLLGPSGIAAQLNGMPMWNSPRAGTGLLIAGDVGRPDSAGEVGTTLDGRVAFGVHALTLGASFGTNKPAGSESITEYGGTAAYRLIGGALQPVAVNLQGGFGRASAFGVVGTRYTGAVGFSLRVPTPGVSVEPWVAPGVRLNPVGATATSASQEKPEFGIAGGLTVSIGVVGVHAAADFEQRPGGGHTTILGLGAQLNLRPPLGGGG
jgi:hypothetical protein